jgi:hypothetical protein
MLDTLSTVPPSGAKKYAKSSSFPSHQFVGYVIIFHNFNLFFIILI